MSLLPSSSVVSERLNSLREARAIAKAEFRSAVEAASIEWEAELLLALEEFRDAGGLALVQERVRAGIERERRDASLNRHRAAMLERIPRDDPHNTRLCELFLADRLDLEAGLMSVCGNATLFLKGDPTMETERAALRIRLLAGVYKEIREAILAEIDAQEARDRAMIEDMRRIEREAQEASQRLFDAQRRISRGIAPKATGSSSFYSGGPVDSRSDRNAV